MIVPLQLAAQTGQGKIKIGAISGYAFYSQEDLKSLNQIILNQLPFEAQIVDEFKPGFFFGAFTQYELFSRFYLGPNYEYYYAGSRLGAEDYSGLFYFDQYIKVHQLGLKIDYAVLPLNRTVFNIEMNVGANFTDWLMDSYFEIRESGEYAEQMDKLKGLSWYFSPALIIELNMFKCVDLIGSIAYSFDLLKNYHYEGNRNTVFQMTPNWTGLKLSTGIVISFL